MAATAADQDRCSSWLEKITMLMIVNVDEEDVDERMKGCFRVWEGRHHI